MPDYNSILDSINAYNTNLGAYNTYLNSRIGNGNGGLGFWQAPEVMEKSNAISSQYGDLTSAIKAFASQGKGGSGVSKGSISDSLSALRSRGINLPDYAAPKMGDTNKGGISKQYLMPLAAAVVGSFLGPAVGTAFGSTLGATTLGAIGSGVGSGVGSLSSGKSIGSSLANAAGTFAGSMIGDKVFSSLGTVGSAIGQTPLNAAGPGYNSLAASAFGQNAGVSVGNAIRDFGQSAIGSGILNTSIGGAIGGFKGGSIAETLAGGNVVRDSTPMVRPAPFEPKQEDEQDTPPSISGLGSLTPNQRTTNLATQGVYGRGTSPTESSYFLNQINRRLVDPGGKVSDMSNINPIEQSYLGSLGFSGYDNPTSLLEAISKWRMGQA